MDQDQHHHLLRNLETMELFRTLVGLPGTGPLPEQFSATGRGTHREGFVVEFYPGTASSWVGNFQRGFGNHEDVILYPNGRFVLVIASGEGYLVDPKDRRLVQLLSGNLEYVITLSNAKILIVSDGQWLEGHGERGFLWRSRRVSWDGIWDLHEDNGRLHGNCWDALTDTEGSFSVDTQTGEVVGGTYPA